VGEGGGGAGDFMCVRVRVCVLVYV